MMKYTTWAMAFVMTAMMMAPIALALDIPDINNGGQIDVNVSEPHIRTYLLYANGAPLVNVTKSPIDVKNNTLGLTVSTTHGLGSGTLDTLYVHMWYDFGVDPSSLNNVAGDYWNIDFEYDYGLDGVTLNAPTNGEIFMNAHARNDPDGNTVDLDFNFDLTGYMRWAPGDGAWEGPNVVEGYTNINSWNFEVILTDTLLNSAIRTDEFGTYKWSSVTLQNANIGGGGAPNENDVPLTGVGDNAVVYQSNAPHKFEVSMDGNLLVGGVGPAFIPATAVSISGVDIGAESNFPGVGVGNELILVGDADEFRVVEDATAPTFAPAVDTYNGNPAMWMDTGLLTWEVDIGAVSEGMYWTTYSMDIITALPGNANTGTSYGTALS